MWNGTAETLKARPAITKTRPTTTPSAAALPAQQRLARSGEVGGAGEAVDQRGAVEQHARGQRAEDEVFQPGLGRAQRCRGGRRPGRRAPGTAARARDRARSGRWPRPSASCRASRTGSARELEAPMPLALARSSRATAGCASAAPSSDQHLHERGEAVGDEQAVEGRAARVRAEHAATAGDQQRADAASETQASAASPREARRRSSSDHGRRRRG